jgi:hypothetical protein
MREAGVFDGISLTPAADDARTPRRDLDRPLLPGHAVVAIMLVGFPFERKRKL